MSQIDSSGAEGDPQILELRRRLAERPGDARLHFQWGEILLARRDCDAAIRSFQRAVELAPHVAAAHFGLANAYYVGERFEEAIASFRAAQDREADAPTANNLGNALARLRRFDEAEAAFTEALQLNPEFVPAMVNLGRAALARNDATTAVEWLERAVGRDPQRGPLLVLLGDAQLQAGHVDHAAVQFARAAVLLPNDATVFHRLGDVNRRRGRGTESLFCYAKALELDPMAAATHSALLDVWQCDADASGEQFAQEARHWAVRHAPRQPRLPPRAAADPSRRLRIGYVSPDFRDCAIGRFVETILTIRHPGDFESICYSLGSVIDDRTRSLRAVVAGWRDAAELSSEQFAQLVRDDAVDILVDLAGHGAGNRLLTFAARPAPVQVTWQGYPGTTGLKEIDYLLADRRLVLPDEEGEFVERIVYLDGGYACFTPPTTEELVESSPDGRRDGPTFGAFHDPVRITPSVVQAWSMLLLERPDSTLFMKSSELENSGARDHLAAQFADYGIEGRRLRFEGGSRRREYLEAYADVDVALDTFPCDGGLALLDALWMGVPVVHLRGRRFAGRRGDALLHAAGLGEFVVDSLDAYRQTAQGLVETSPRSAERQARLRSQLLGSPLCDTAAFVAGLAGAFREMWRKACAAPR